MERRNFLKALLIGPVAAKAIPKPEDKKPLEIQQIQYNGYPGLAFTVYSTFSGTASNASIIYHYYDDDQDKY